MSKKNLRKKLINLRKKNFKVVEIKNSTLEKIIRKSSLKKNQIVGAYYPINFEIDCFEILKKIEKIGFTICLPVTEKKFEMNFFKWSFNEPLKIGNLGVPEPYKIKKLYPDLLFVPLVAFDKFKYRLGYGGGYYDRYLAKFGNNRLTKIGIGFSFQKVKSLPIEKYDQKLNFIITEKNLIK